MLKKISFCFCLPLKLIHASPYLGDALLGITETDLNDPPCPTFLCVRGQVMAHTNDKLTAGP